MLSQAGTGFSLSLDDGLERLHLLLFNKLPHTLSGLNNIHHLLSLKSLWVDWDQLGGSSWYMASFWSREVWLDGNIQEGYLYLTWLTQWTWVWVNSGSWWWTGKPGMLWSMELQRVGHDLATELNWWLPFWQMWDSISLWFSFAFPWWSVVLSIFSCVQWLFVCLQRKKVYPHYLLIFF